MNSIDQDQLKSHIAREMRTLTGASLVGVYRDEKGVKKLLGSGTFVQILGLPYILTAAHVLYDGLRRYGGLYYAPLLRGTPVPVFQYWYWGYPPALHEDIGLIRIAPEHAEYVLPSCWDLDVLSSDSCKEQKDLLFLQGYPQTHEHAAGEAGRAETVGMVTKALDADLRGFDPGIHIALNYPPVKSDSDGIETWLSAESIGGSALWSSRYLQVQHAKTAWTSRMSRLIGVLHFGSEGEFLIATRIEIVRQQILHFLREEKAYYLWEHRGGTHGGHLQDWLKAEQAIPDL